MSTPPMTGRAVSDRGRRKEWWCRLVLRGLVASFLIVGTIVPFLPDGPVRAMSAVGSWLGHFTPAPPSALRFWLSLATGYMVLVTAPAYLAQRRPAQRRGDVPRRR